VAPIIGFVPEGDIDPPTFMMKYPGSFSVTETTYEALLTDVCSSLRAHGFRNIVLIGDSGGNQDGLKNVAAALSAKWTDGKTRVIYIPEYYNYGDVAKWVEQQGIKQVDEGLHDDYAMTAMMMAVDPDSVRTRQRIKANKFRINGVDLAPMEKTIAFGKKAIEYRADVAVKAIHAALSK
jgi:creatinine amidohydrolase/Fe(II)-dependent formamide hydrolase-like protein